VSSYPVHTSSCIKFGNEHLELYTYATNNIVFLCDSAAHTLSVKFATMALIARSNPTYMKCLATS
jgi:hypothetical protein